MESVSRRELLGAGVGLTLGLAGMPASTTGSLATTPMVLIPAGPFLKGTTELQAEQLALAFGYHPTWLAAEVPQRVIDLPAFLIDVHPVTVAQYALFCAATGHRLPNDQDGCTRQQLLDHPVVGVSHADATAYAAWAKKRLPTELEWEKAARGTDGRLWPWGDVFDPDASQWNRLRTPDGPKTAPVLTHPSGNSPYGVSDMAGNVAEWCFAGPNPAMAIVKGGSWYTEEPLNLRPAARNVVAFCNLLGPCYGFRCAKDGP